MQFSILSEAFQQIASTSKRLEKTGILSSLLQDIPEKDLPDVMLLLRGRVYPDWDKTTLGISEKLTIKAIALTAGVPEKDIARKFKELGDLGKVAGALMVKKKQATLFQKDLEVQGVVSILRKIPTLEGHGSVDQKLKHISQLLSNASSLEAQFLVRILLEDSE